MTAQRRLGGRHGAAELGGEVDGPEAAVAVGVERPRERLGHRHGLGLRVVDRRVAVGVREGLGELVLGEAGDLLEHLASGVGVDVLVGAGPQHVAATEHLEEVELDVAQVALVVAHGRVLRCRSVSACLPVCYPPVTNARGMPERALEPASDPAPSRRPGPPLAGAGRRHTRAGEHRARAAAPTRGRARHRRAAPGRHAPRAALRPRLRRRHREQRGRAAPRPRRRALRGRRRLPR